MAAIAILDVELCVVVVEPPIDVSLATRLGTREAAPQPGATISMKGLSNTLATPNDAGQMRN